MLFGRCAERVENDVLVHRDCRSAKENELLGHTTPKPILDNMQTADTGLMTLPILYVLQFPTFNFPFLDDSH